MRHGGPLMFSLRLMFYASLLALWELAVKLLEVPAFLVPAPSNIAYALYQGLERGFYTEHVYITLEETVLGFALGCLLGFVLGCLIAQSRTIEYFLHPPIVMFQATPKIAMVPIFVIWFGLGITSKMVTAALVAFFPLMVNTIVGMRSADEDRVNLMRSLAASRWQIFQIGRAHV